MAVAEFIVEVIKIGLVEKESKLAAIGIAREIIHAGPDCFVG